MIHKALRTAPPLRFEAQGYVAKFERKAEGLAVRLINLQTTRQQTFEVILTPENVEQLKAYLLEK